MQAGRRLRWIVRSWLCIAVILLCNLGAFSLAYGFDPATLEQLAAEDSDLKLEAIAKLVASGDATAIPLLQAMQDDALQLFNGRLVIVSGEAAKDALSGESVSAPADQLQPIVINNRVRAALDSGIAALRLVSPQRAERIAAAKVVASDPSAEMLPLIRRALEKESDSEVKELLSQARAMIEIKDRDPTVRREAVKLLGASNNPQVKQIIAALLQKQSDGSPAESDASVRAEAQNALQSIERSFLIPQFVGALFSGISLGSVLLLAALGLAITFGLMGIINMAHGEMLMLGAYATYIVQTFFRAYLADFLDWYLLAALPVAFMVAALVGILLERSVIRFLYGRPLETLLTTWGISLILIQF
ncbi:MAG TPA: urea ABC transporter permease subunit UrtB, partial [Acidobacteriota bacterium]|nr:urea ABC transporter permease subunit UrtB [Acidobacteriota bacterium]